LNTSAAANRQRVREIGSYHVLTDPPRRDLVALVEVAALVADVPLATINLITEAEQHSIATKGFDASICRREDSMCTVAIEETKPVVVADASQDNRFKDNPFVSGELGAVRFYAAFQLVTPAGTTIGTLCVFDDKPRLLTAQQRSSLTSLAERVVDLLELELRSRELSSSLSALEAARIELEHSNHKLTAFAGQVSHDLDNPLTAVSMAIKLLGERFEGEDGTTDAEAEWLLDRATNGTQRMHDLIRALLDFAKIGGQLAQTKVDLQRLVAQVREDLTPVLTDATVDVGALPVVMGDAVQLRAVMQNLVANAAKFTRPGVAPVISIHARREDTMWRIEVADQGPGVPAAERERVFEPLARASDEHPGTGIGLATVRRIVQAHGGVVVMGEAPGGGTAVSFTLPS
jgi:signal transduction histidine kinase